MILNFVNKKNPDDLSGFFLFYITKAYSIINLLVVENSFVFTV